MKKLILILLILAIVAWLIGKIELVVRFMAWGAGGWRNLALAVLAIGGLIWILIRVNRMDRDERRPE